MYDHAWSEKVYHEYRMSCPRTEQINLCIEQSILRLDGSIQAPQALIRAQLINSIQGRDKNALWRLYKHLCKASPLDQSTLCRVVTMLYSRYRDEILQIFFDF